MATPHPSTASLRSGCHLPLKVKALSNIIAKKTAGDKPPPYCEIDYFVLSTIILFKFVWDSTHPSAIADTFSHKRRLADVNLPTTVLSKAKLYIFINLL